MQNNNGIHGNKVGSWDQWAVWVVKTLESHDDDLDWLKTNVTVLKTKSAFIGAIAGLVCGGIIAVVVALLT